MEHRPAGSYENEKLCFSDKFEYFVVLIQHYKKTLCVFVSCSTLDKALNPELKLEDSKVSQYCGMLYKVRSTREHIVCEYYSM